MEPETRDRMATWLLRYEREYGRWEDDGGAPAPFVPAFRLLLPELMSPRSEGHPWRSVPADPDAPPPLGISAAARAAWNRQLEARQ